MKTFLLKQKTTFKLMTLLKARVRLGHNYPLPLRYNNFFHTSSSETVKDEKGVVNNAADQLV